MTRTFKRIATGAATLAAIAALGSPAWAGCGPELKPASWQKGANDGAGYMPAAFTARSVVGMWSFKFLDDNNNLIDFGYVQWHSDGTEIMNSGGRAPATENFCLGVWAQVGPAQYALNHQALSYDPSTGKLNAKITIRENVVVDQTNAAYTGPFSIEVFDPNTDKRLQKITGHVFAERITAR